LEVAQNPSHFSPAIVPLASGHRVRAGAFLFFHLVFNPSRVVSNKTNGGGVETVETVENPVNLRVPTVKTVG
jgi:FPC/CPF motif-containing protein YcgG